MTTPSRTQFYFSITAFLQCVNLTTKFEGQIPNEYQMITHEKDNDGVFIRYKYNPFQKIFTHEKLDLVDEETGLENYRFHLALKEDELLTGVSGYKGEKICPVFNKVFEEKNCRKETFFEILGPDLVRIGCGSVASNVLFKLNGTKLTTYMPEVQGQFNCESKRAVFGDKIVFKNKGEDVCKEIDWAADHVWKASECAKNDKFKLNSKNFLLFPLNYILIKFSEERCIQPYPEVIDYLNNTYVKYLYNPKGRSTSKNVTIATVEEEPLNKAALGGGIAGALVFLLLLIGLTVFLIRRYRNKQYRRHPASHVRYEFSVAMGMRKPKKCKDGFDVVRLKSGKKLAVPRVIDYAAAKRMVAEGEFGAFYEYESQGTSYWYKLEAKLGSRFKQPLANESGVYKLVEKYFKNPEKHFMYYGGMLGCCQFSEGVYCMRVEHFGPSVREMRGGQLMAPPEAKKLFFQLLHCIRAMIKYGISHRYIKESAFYAKQDEDKYWFVITDLGYAIRMGSERSAFYPIPELATTHIHAKKALKVEDAESLLFMILGMMAPLPWTGMEDMEEIRKTKLECTDEKSIAMEFKDIPEAVELCRMRGLYTDDVACENPADSLITCCLQTTPFEKMCLPVLFPNSNAKLVGTFQSYGS